MFFSAISPRNIKLQRDFYFHPLRDISSSSISTELLSLMSAAFAINSNYAMNNVFTSFHLAGEVSTQAIRRRPNLIWNFILAVTASSSFIKLPSDDISIERENKNDKTRHEFELFAITVECSSEIMTN